MTIAVAGEILAQPQDGSAGYESTWYWIVNQLFGELFPVPQATQPHYTRYHRISRNAERLLAKLALSVLPANRTQLINSKPLPVANPKSPPLGKRFFWSQFPEATKGFGTMGMVFGFKLHTFTNLEGLFESWTFAAANHTDLTRTQRVRL